VNIGSPQGTIVGAGAVPAFCITLPAETIEAIRQIARQEAELVLERHTPEPSGSPYMTIQEAATLMRCSRQRVDDLLSKRRLTRFKDGRRTLLSRQELEIHLRNGDRTCPVRRSVHNPNHPTKGEAK